MFRHDSETAFINGNGLISAAASDFNASDKGSVDFLICLSAQTLG